MYRLDQYCTVLFLFYFQPKLKRRRGKQNSSKREFENVFFLYVLKVLCTLFNFV